LRKLTSNLLLFLDGDSAGIENMIKVLPMLIEKGFNVKILIAENGMDAADVCLKCKFNRDYMQAYITSHSKPAINVVIDRAVNEYEQVVVRERIKAMNTIAPLLEKIPSEYEKDIFKSMAYKRLDLAGV
jgi:DNA primase